ncbi:hemerythrin domain-containing protein [Aspergillus udagawae]|uniref:Hemerythrin-like domain-containing protein n=1 Tax=Aspergillus udagawae TaxID=91492 RepID=A0A8E0QXC4_9EURO|nr:uncharacterized protein Aud_009679 [Aspergillus udagawae]GIC93197.1 hypothetical protein Aud_009679 [Aspergillus udagawae]
MRRLPIIQRPSFLRLRAVPLVHRPIFLVATRHQSFSVMSQKKHQASPDSSSQPDGNNEPLPPLSPKDFRTYNRMAEQMDQFHNHFRLTWNQLQDACTSTGKKPGGLSPRQLIMAGLSFCSQLDFHHSIEEQHIFPVLAKKMPEFRRELALLSQHRQIHKGLEKLEAYLTKCRSGEVDLQREEIKRLMDGFGEVLWKHLDEEVRTLGAENMRRYWSLQEMARLPM